jgi:hypothetical protein
VNKIFSLLGLLLLVINTVQASVINPDPSTDIPAGTVLFNFQVPEANEGALLPGFQSQLDSSISITAVSVNIAGGVAWLDDPFLDNGNLLPGGLGVCPTDDCEDNDADAVNQGESVLLTVSEAITVGDIYFRNGSHENDFASNFGVRIDGGAIQEFVLASVVSDLAAQVISSTIEFIRLGNIGSVYNEKRDFYVAGFGAPVPLPAALPMMILGLLGLFGFRKVAA